jgi:phage antirepressor YoqD-like protein
MNNIFIQVAGCATMTSIELVAVINELRDPGRAELRHDTFMVKVAKVIGEGVQKFLDTYQHPQNGQPYSCYRLPKREASLMAMSESHAVQARVYDRMVELEAGRAFRVPTTLGGALRLAADQAEQIDAQLLQLAEAAPAVAFVDQYVDTTGLLGFRQMCKLLKANEIEFGDFLLDRGIWHRLESVWSPHKRHIWAGRCVTRVGVSTKNNHAFTSAKFTSKGATWVAGEWAKYQLLTQQAGGVAQ